jgi:hypothetical protein
VAANQGVSWVSSSRTSIRETRRRRRKEYYDLATDRYQLENLAGKRPGLEAELAARLRALEDCAGETCRTAEDGRAP